MPTGATALLPELVIAGLVLVVLALDLVTGSVGRRATMGAVVLLGVLAALALALERWSGGDLWLASFSGALVSDRLSRLFGAALLTGAAGVVLLTLGQREPARDVAPGAYYSLVLASILGALAAVGADDLPVLGLGLALASVPVQILARWGGGVRRREAALRLGQSSGLAWGVFVVGLAAVWSAAGTVDYGDLAPALDEGLEPGLALAGLALVWAAVLLSAGTVLPHFPVVDVHQAAAAPVGALLLACVAPAALVGAIRLQVWVYDPLAAIWGPATAALAVMAAGAGATMAAAQDRLRRLIAALVCSHGGALVLGLASGGEQGLTGTLFLLLVQGLAVLGLAGLFQAAGLGAATRLRDLGGLAARRPFLALALACCVLSLCGVPPTAGFAGRMLAYRAAAVSGLGWPLTLVGASQMVAAWAVIRLLAATAGEGAPAPAASRLSPATAAVILLATAALIGLGLHPQPLVEACRQTALSLM